MHRVKQDKQVDGVEYELTVRDGGRGYFGAWFCRSCWEGGVRYDLVPTREQAFAQAEDGALQHHERLHKLAE